MVATLVVLLLLWLVVMLVAGAVVGIRFGGA